MKTLTTHRYPYNPDYIVTPGAVLQETIDALGMTQAQLATRAGLSRKTINQVVRGQEPITCETALRLERVTNVPAHFWINLEAKYRERLLRATAHQWSAENQTWLKTIPTKELLQRGVIPPVPDPVSLLEAVLAFFGVNSPQQWEAVWREFRLALPTSQTLPNPFGCLATWLRLGELGARRLPCQRFDRAQFAGALTRVRSLTATAPAQAAVPQAQQLCAAAGVALVLVREFDGAPVSGAAQWLVPDKALIQLTLRGKTDDRFWFTFFHEAGHILKHGKKTKFIDGDVMVDNAQEDEANRFATDLLIPRSRLAELRALRTRDEIVAFAQSLGIAAGIVLARLQLEKLIPERSQLNDLKVRWRWAGDAEKVTLATA